MTRNSGHLSPYGDSIDKFLLLLDAIATRGLEEISRWQIAAPRYENTAKRYPNGKQAFESVRSIRRSARRERLSF
jgi:hypothetical protein